MSASYSPATSVSERPLAPVIQYMDPSQGSLHDVPESLRQHVLKSYENQQVGVLVSDMSGFTKLTRKHGIIHFTSIIARCRQLCFPILHKFGAILITAEGDSLNVIFPTAAGALSAALRMQKAAYEYNNTLPPSRAHFAITLKGVGVDYGPGPLLDKEGKLLGQTFTNAHLLGEELCSKGRVALSQRCRAEAERSAGFSSSCFSPMLLEDSSHAHEAIEAMGSLFELNMQVEEPIQLESCDACEYVNQDLLPFCLRHSPALSESALNAMDHEIRQSHMQRKAVLMFDFVYQNADSPQAALHLKFDCISRLEGIFKLHNAFKVEDVLYLFDDPVDAILTAEESRRVVQSFNRQTNAWEPHVGIKGSGIHLGEVLYIEGSDVHWGDPVNTASKLGQDFADNGDIIISEQTYESCGRDTRLQQLVFEQIELEISGLNFKPYKVFSADPSNASNAALGHAEGLKQNARRASSRMVDPCESATTDDPKERIIAHLERGGFPLDMIIEGSWLPSLLKTLDSSLIDEHVAMMINEAARSLPGGKGLTLVGFIDWMFSSKT